MYRRFIKPTIDFIIALISVVLLSPVILLIIVLLSVANMGNPFFFQQRPGKNERIFRIIKFRTMSNKKDANGNLLPDSERLTTIGKIIRSSSLDEIPQLINVVKGEMSLIGPRPLLPEYLPLYSKEQRKRHHVRPGITGWAQVNGRNSLSWQKKFEMDVWYVRNVNFFLDIKIFLLTIKKVLVSDGINAQGQATTERFKGNK